jgi:predicted nucleotidyltransferase
MIMVGSIPCYRRGRAIRPPPRRRLRPDVVHILQILVLTSDYDTSMATADLPIWAPTPEKMQAAIERLVAAAQPTRIILFGSRARGDADDRSDVDLLVIKHHVTDRYEELVALDRALAGILMLVDILLVSEAEFGERAEQPGTVERAARTEGRVLYAA